VTSRIFVLAFVAALCLIAAAPKSRDMNGDGYGPQMVNERRAGGDVIRSSGGTFTNVLTIGGTSTTTGTTITAAACTAPLGANASGTFCTIR
jgi:hypothetical protein